ncbi:hypothetical protein [Streptomyces sp. NPDC017958]
MTQAPQEEGTRLDHLGIEVESTEAIHATTRLSASGLVSAQ